MKIVVSIDPRFTDGKLDTLQCEYSQELAEFVAELERIVEELRAEFGGPDAPIWSPLRRAQEAEVMRGP
jgi:hypothetical protein